LATVGLTESVLTLVYAVAIGLSLTVTYPRAGNLGGGGFMVIALADGRTTTIDYRETAPAKAERNMYVDAKGNVVPGLSLIGHKASGVPGTVAGLALALEKYGSGKFTFAELVEPSRRLAAEGMAMPQGLANDLRTDQKLLSRFPETKRIFLRDGRFYEAGEPFAQPDLAATLARLAKEGPREFYEGETGRRIVAEMEKNGGLITKEDLRTYHAVERPALRTTYRDYEIFTMPPPSSGGIVLFEMLAMLEPRNLPALGHASAAKYHLFVEMMRRAYRDRSEYLGDPDFVNIPVAGLLDKSYAQNLMKNFDPDHATSSATLAAGVPAGIEPRAPKTPSDNSRRESMETTQFSVVDSAGNAVSNTYTLNGLFGSGVTVPGTGLLLNNEMDDFASTPGKPNSYGLLQGEANAIAPHKRPLSSMTPTIVRKNGKVFLVTGSPGGSTIINSVFLILTGIIDEGLNVTQAVEQPRFHHQWMPDTLRVEDVGLSPDTIEILESRGHKIDVSPAWSDGECVSVDPKTGERMGASDPRFPGKAVGY